MGTDLYSEAVSAILSFLNAKGDFQIEGTSLTIEAPDVMDNEKVRKLKDNIDRTQPKNFYVEYVTNAKGQYFRCCIKAPSVRALRDFLMKLMRRLETEKER